MVLLLLGAAALYIGFWLAVRLRSLLVLLLISFFLAFALEPAANVLARRGWRRSPATAVVFALLAVAVLAVVVLAVVVLLGSLLISQVAGLVDATPGYTQQVTAFLNDKLGTDLSGGELADKLRGTRGSTTSSAAWPPGPSA